MSQHFLQADFERSEAATRLGIDNTVPLPLLPKLERLMALLEKVRTLVGPITISSGYRCPQVNAAVGGAANSAHMQARAADINAGLMKPRDLAQYIAASAIQFDKLIMEFGAWVHVQVEEDGEIPRRQVLTAKKMNGTTVYVQGLE